MVVELDVDTPPEVLAVLRANRLHLSPIFGSQVERDAATGGVIVGDAE